MKVLVYTKENKYNVIHILNSIQTGRRGEAQARLTSEFNK